MVVKRGLFGFQEQMKIRGEESILFQDNGR